MKVLICVLFVFTFLLGVMIAGQPSFQQAVVKLGDERLVLIALNMEESVLVPHQFIPWAVQEGDIVTITIIRRAGLTKLRRQRIRQKLAELRQ